MRGRGFEPATGSKNLTFALDPNPFGCGYLRAHHFVGLLSQGLVGQGVERVPESAEARPPLGLDASARGMKDLFAAA
jgi:hypothetical protein